VYVQKRSAVFLTIPLKYNMTSADIATLNTLPDIGFDLIPQLQYSNLADIWVGVVVGGTVFRFALTSMRLTILRRWLFNLGAMFLLRGFTIMVTMLPNPLHDCVSTADVDGQSVAGPFLQALLILTGQSSTCADVLFSGHTVNLTLMALVWHHYSHVVPVVDSGCNAFCARLCKPRLHSTALSPVKLTGWLIVIGGYLIIIATHFHYSVDVWIGFLMTMFVWKLYHSRLDTCHTRSDWPHRFMTWFERAAEDIRGSKQTSVDVMAPAIITLRCCASSNLDNSITDAPATGTRDPGFSYQSLNTGLVDELGQSEVL